jgi:hypothetical protein
MMKITTTFPQLNDHCLGDDFTPTVREATAAVAVDVLPKLPIHQSVILVEHGRMSAGYFFFKINFFKIVRRLKIILASKL